MLLVDKCVVVILAHTPEEEAATFYEMYAWLLCIIGFHKLASDLEQVLIPTLVFSRFKFYSKLFYTELKFA